MVAKTPLFYVTIDPFRQNLPGDLGWVPLEKGGSQRRARYWTDVHELLYRVYDADGNFCGEGTTTNRNDDEENLEGWYLASQYHQNDSGSVTIKVYDRKTGEFLFSN